MTDAQTPTRFDEDIRIALAGKHLPAWSPLGIGAVAVVLAVALWALGIADSAIEALVVAVVLFLVFQTGWSLAVEGSRRAVDRLVRTSVNLAVVLAVIPLVAILITVIAKGFQSLSLEFITGSMRNVSPRLEGGGVFHALIGTVEQVAMATLISVPVGILIAVYLVEYGRGKLATSVSFFVDVMTGVPSIVAGLFVYTGLVLTLGMPRSGFAASVALVILMLPVVVRTTEEMLRLIPRDLREASYALGAPKWITILKVVIPGAMSGIVTGVMLAIARVAGETAPLLLTTFLTQSVNWNLFSGPQASLPTFIWDQISSGTEASINRAWGGALVLILFVALLYIAARITARLLAPKTR